MNAGRATLSLRANDVCGAREQVIAAIAGRRKAIPDLKWEIREVLVSFKLTSIDVHTIEGGKIVRSYHIEDWLGAVRQLSGK